MKAVQRIIEIQADSTGSRVVPDRIELMQAGKWNTPWHGSFEMTVEDLHQMVANFDAGIGLVKDSKRAPINYGHNDGGKAAGWINKLAVEGDRLMGDIEWTPAGRKALDDTEYRYISPEWNPRSMPWEDPEKDGTFVDNVFLGAAVTNIPLFTKLKPVMASRDGSNGGGDTSNDKQGENMDLSQIRAKALEDLTDDEKAFLEEHKEELNDEERTKFGLVDKADDADSDGDKADDADDDKADDAAEDSTDDDDAADSDDDGDDKKKTADRKAGVTISAEELKNLKASAARADKLALEIETDKASKVMASAVRTGKVKQDQKDAGVALLLADRDGKFKAFIEALPENKLLASEQGRGDKTENEVELSQEEKELAESFGNTAEEIAEYKKSQNKSN